jgi:hypothetical protein
VDASGTWGYRAGDVGWVGSRFLIHRPIDIVSLCHYRVLA